MNIVVKYLLKLKYEYRSVVGSTPRLSWLHRPVIWWQQYKIRRYYREHGADPRDCVVGPHTEFVLDGFQGSANSFAAAAFQHCQARRVQMAHHMHSPAQIIEGVRRGLPTLVTIRPPTGAVPSLVSRWPYVSMRQGLRGYVRFYEALAPYADGFVISPFEQTTRHLGEGIRQVNRRFGTDFVPFDHTEENMEAMWDHLEDLGNAEERFIDEEARDALKRRQRRELRQRSSSDLLARAEALHQRLTAKTPDLESAS